MSQNLMKIEDLKEDTKKVNIEVKVIRKLDSREVFNKKRRTMQRVANFLIGDETGTYTLTVWDAEIDKIEDKMGESILISNGYVSSFMNKSQLNIGLYGNWKPIKKEIEVTDIPDEEPEELQFVNVADLREGMTKVNIIVKVKEKLEAREVAFRDGTKHRVATTTVGDTTGMINLSLFDDMIEKVNEGEIFQLTNCYIKKFKDTLQLNIGKFGKFEKIKHEDFEINTENLL